MIGGDQVNSEELESERVRIGETAYLSQRNEWQEFFEQTLVKFDPQSGRKPIPVLQNWLAKSEQIPANLKTDPKLQESLKQVCHIAIEKLVIFAKSNLALFNDADGQERKLLARLRIFLNSGPRLDEEIVQQLADLEFVLAYLFDSGVSTTHQFADAELAGVYANLAWTDVANRPFIAQEIERLRQQVEDARFIFQAMLTGAIRCEQNISSALFNPTTLVCELADDYVTERQGQLYQASYPWWATLIGLIHYSTQQNPLLADWSHEQRRKRAHWDSIKTLIDTGLTFMRPLWPLEKIANRPVTVNDANYDFPRSVEEIYEQGGHPIYQLTTPGSGEAQNPTQRVPIAAAEICERYLSQFPHQMVTGQRQAGKTWLRLYLDYYVSITSEEILPVFFFAPATMAFETNTLEIVRTIASSVANQLFASLLVRSGYRTTADDRLRVSRVASARFLQRYDYHVPAGALSLAESVPLDSILDIKSAYGSGPLGDLYAQIQEEMKRATTLSPAGAGDPVERILDDIQSAIELVGYKHVFVTIDNWDHLAARVRQRLLQDLFDADLPIQLQNHNIHLKVFVPEIDSQIRNSLHQVCDLERVRNGVYRRLSLYTYL